MHDTAMQTGKAFFDCYATASGRVLDVGSLDVNGTLRPFVPPKYDYCGIDIVAGPNVTLVLRSQYNFPFAGGEFDLITSTSCLEHDQFFWLTFTEMARVIKPGGYVYISAPVGGPVHRHPIDAWRFYPDAGRALAAWATHSGFALDLIESFIRPPGPEGWQDFVAVFGKRDGGVMTRKAPSLTDLFPDAIHCLP